MTSTNFSLVNYLSDLVQTQKLGISTGIYSVCSSNPYVLDAAMYQARQDKTPVLIESTSNQVNQFGGYMGLTPVQFKAALDIMAASQGLVNRQIILGGDHLGPNVWKQHTAESAMRNAIQLVFDAVNAGYTKIHLDASMRLANDPEGPLPVEVSANRAAMMCQAAERAYQSLPKGSPAPRYVIGSEVPPPGGAKENNEELVITSVDNVQWTIDVTFRAFQKLGLEDAWQRVIAIVVQPGVEFGDTTIHPYQRQKAAALSAYIKRVPNLVYEAHSTDYQTPHALRQLVEDHFAILKVGPALTFAFREAVFALEMIEQELMTGKALERRSNLQDIIEEEMLAHPEHWASYYHGSPEAQRLARRFSLSDRIRYYWARPRVQAALERLLANLDQGDIPLSLISQFLPEQFRRIQRGEISRAPKVLIRDKISEVLRDYRYACSADFN